MDKRVVYVSAPLPSFHYSEITPSQKSNQELNSSTQKQTNDKIQTAKENGRYNNLSTIVPALALFKIIVCENYFKYLL